ncbi:MAG TPA: DUF4215 domain-containing protein [Candidatus Binatia bacterium]|nr:DUF4215 domain-containing protein [Candidatus Binatia bacterium]
MTLGLVAVASRTGMADDTPLRRDVGSYFILASRAITIDELFLPDACNVGVDCPSASGPTCGILRVLGSIFAGSGSQIAADAAFFRGPGSSVAQLFADQVPDPLGLVVDVPGPRPGGAGAFRPPIVGDLDGDGRTSCDDHCRLDAGDIGRACGLPDPFPACDAQGAVPVSSATDCPVNIVDEDPGNGICDLPPGVYGNLNVATFGHLRLRPGDYVFCNVTVGRNATVETSGAHVLIAESGSMSVLTGSIVGSGQLGCSGLTLFAAGRGQVSLGKRNAFIGRLCAPESAIDLGDGNTLIGQFIGATVESRGRNFAGCCVGVCGDGVVDGGEICDPFASGDQCAPGSSCNDDCECEVVCGDGQIGEAEVCDPGAAAPTCPLGTSCNDDCTTCETACGDGQIGGTEICDPGAPATTCPLGTSCTNDCTACTAVCGDGVVADSEICDPPGTGASCGEDAVCGSSCDQCLACPTTTPIPPEGGTAHGTTSGASKLGSGCATTAAAPESTFSWIPAVSGDAVLETCGNETNFDTVLSVHDETCAGPERACNDDACGTGSRVVVPVVAGRQYVIVVDGYGTDAGRFALTIIPPANVLHEHAKTE